MEERIYITEEFKQELANLGCEAVDYITTYRTEGNKVFFTAGRCKFHITKAELETSTLTVD
jgi:hypothetical protein